MHSFDLAQLSATDNYKLLTGLVTPRPIALVTSLDAAGHVNAAPFSYFNVFGTDPALLILCIANRPGTNEPKDSAANIAATGEFVVHLVDEAIAQQMNLCSGNYPSDVNEMQLAGFTAEPSVRVKPPRIAESPVHLECVLEQIQMIGENRIVIGRVLMLHVREEIVDAERCHVRDGVFFPIGRMHGRGWYTRTRDQFEMLRP